ncbi:nitroreductase family protein [Mycobacterium angelicum]|uniref:Nitroreductase domain-containing protein n=1 Tax=Mycobacterium angelicum TaxID=470074 RepID=A0A1X0A2U9_MYCAN|nr:nitroreductase family protein [Mycobacterium angelicum]MCV7197239.1 nitroreductase family protein [Mycobacterium angelicum]ORA24322.1 hypothetical protein BST12_06020 [Mycobacterium angelicum]
MPVTDTNAKEFIDLILRRRSIRETFTSEPVPTTDLVRIVECGLAAPSSKNAQPWRFHIVQDRVLLDSIADCVQEAKGAAAYGPQPHISTGLPRKYFPSTVIESVEILRIAPVGIFVENRGVFSGRKRQLASTGTSVKAITGYGSEMLGIGAAVENMWLAANALGFGAVFMADVLVAEDIIKRKLCIRGDLVGVLSLGPHDGGGRPSMGARLEDLTVWR